MTFIKGNGCGPRILFTHSSVLPMSQEVRLKLRAYTAEGTGTLTPPSPTLHLTAAKIPGILQLPGCYLLLSLPLFLFISLTSRAQVSQAQALIPFAFLSCLLVTMNKWASHPWALLGTPGLTICPST